MHCSHCQTPMLETQISRGHHSEQTWYECPICGQVQLYSRCVAETSYSSPAGRLAPLWHIWSEQRRQQRSLGQLPRVGDRGRREALSRSVT
jgi:hypothetical protein